MVGLKLLCKSPNSKDFNPGDVYSVNPAFKSGQLKIRLPVAHAKENKT